MNITTKVKIIIGILAVGGSILFWTCTTQATQIWVYIEPIQCLGNPWDQDWLKTHDYDEYPKNKSEQLKIVTDYYRTQGVAIHDIYSQSVYDAVCAACSCPTGERVYCLVDERNVDFMLAEGWSRAS